VGATETVGGGVGAGVDDAGVAVVGISVVTVGVDWGFVLMPAHPLNNTRHPKRRAKRTVVRFVLIE
jgi:hypothetical protein